MFFINVLIAQSIVLFSQPVGVVDGNVIRVLSRLRCIGADVSQPSTMDSMWYVFYNEVFI